MRGFPDALRPENIGQFGAFMRRRTLAYLRRHVFEAMLKPSFGPAVQDDEEPKSYGIDLTSAHLGTFQGGYRVDQSLVEALCQELEEHGWETSVGYGGTMLFVFPPGERPEEALEMRSFE